MKNKMIIAMDGPAGSGKSTTAKSAAKALKLPYIDTGAMYRAITFLAMKEGVDWSDSRALTRLAREADIDFREDRSGKQRVLVNGEDVTEAIRTPELTNQVHHVASTIGVRKQMVHLQRKLGARRGGVLEGRDIGTVVFPKADWKFYLDADFQLRAKRRHKELVAKGIRMPIKAVERDLRARDKKDLGRRYGGLKPAKDSIRLDTTALTIEETVAIISKIVSSRSRAGKGTGKAL